MGSVVVIQKPIKKKILLAFSVFPTFILLPLALSHSSTLNKMGSEKRSNPPGRAVIVSKACYCLAWFSSTYKPPVWSYTDIM